MNDYFRDQRLHYLSHIASQGIDQRRLPDAEGAALSLARGLGRRMYRRGCYLNSTTARVVRRFEEYAGDDSRLFARMCLELAQGAVESNRPIGRMTVCVALAKLLEHALESGDLELQFLLATSPALHRLIDAGIAGRMVKGVLRFHLIGLRDAVHGDALSAAAHVAYAAGQAEKWELFTKSADAAERHLRKWANKLLNGEVKCWSDRAYPLYQVERYEHWLR